MKFNKKKINKIKILDENFREILFKNKENIKKIFKGYEI